MVPELWATGYTPLVGLSSKVALPLIPLVMNFGTTDFFNTSYSRLNELFVAAWKNNPLNLIYTLVRVEGISDTNWDPMEESLEAFEDYKNIREDAFKHGNLKRVYRLQLLHYCHMIEASAPLELIANLLRCNRDMGFHIRPFMHLNRATKETFVSIPPSVKTKVKEIAKLEEKSSVKVSDLLNQIMNDQIRNSYFHSDYCLTDSYFRSMGSGLASQMRLEDLNKITNNAFSFYSALIGTWNGIREQLGRGKRVHQMPNYECLELLSGQDGVLNGFMIHFSNGSTATFKRTKEGLTAENLMFERDGNVNFHCGIIGDLKPYWVWNKQVVTDFSKVP